MSENRARPSRSLLISAAIGLAWLALAGGCSGGPAADPAVAPAAAPAVASAGTSAIPSATEVFARHAKAVGGSERWNASTARTARSEIHIAGGSDAFGNRNDVVGTMVVVRKAPNRLLSVTTLPGIGTIRSGFDGAVGWVHAPGAAPRRLDGSELAELTREAQFNFQLDMRGAYPNAECVGPFKMLDAMCWRVRLSADERGTADAYFDQQSGLCVALGRTLKAGGQLLQVTRYLRDYKDFGGLLMPSRIDQSVGDTEQSELLTAVDFAPVSDAVFAPPANLP